MLPCSSRPSNCNHRFWRMPQAPFGAYWHHEKLSVSLLIKRKLAKLGKAGSAQSARLGGAALIPWGHLPSCCRLYEACPLSGRRRGNPFFPIFRVLFAQDLDRDKRFGLMPCWILSLLLRCWHPGFPFFGKDARGPMRPGGQVDGCGCRYLSCREVNGLRRWSAWS
jgi:hypothetical protein